MSIARALTTRRKEENPLSAAYIGRAASQRAQNAKPIKRSDISLPVALISTTNMLSYEAPDIVDAPHVQKLGGRYFSNGSVSSSSTPSDNESEHSNSVRSYETDATSVEMNSPDPTSDSYYHNYFKAPAEKRATSSTTASSASTSQSAAPAQPSPRPSMDAVSVLPQIPQRAPSHSMKAHVLSHKRSVQRMATISAAPSTQSRVSCDMFVSDPVEHAAALSAVSHPFGKELEQLNEVAEEFGHAVRSAEFEADLLAFQTKGLARHCANEYMDEISSIYSTTFDDHVATYQPAIWI